MTRGASNIAVRSAFFALFVALLVALGGGARAQIPESVLHRTIESVEARSGGGRVDLGELDDDIVGAELTRETVRRFLDRLVASRRFADVQIDVDPDRTPLVLEVRLVPMHQLMRIDVHENHALTDAQIRDRIGVAIGDDVDAGDLDAIAARIRDAYAERGYEACEVDARLLDAGDGMRVVLLVELREGEPTEVRAIRFTGDQPPGAGGGVRPLRSLVGDHLDLERIEAAIASSQTKLREAGYYDARLGEASVARDGSRATVVVPLHLGPHYRVEVYGERPLLRDDVVDALDLEDASTDDAGIETMKARARDFFLRNGFLDARAEVHVEREEGSSEAVLWVEIERGPAVRVSSLQFPGAAHFGRRYLREQIESFLDDELRGSGFGEPVDPEVLDRLVGGAQREGARFAPEVLYISPEKRYYAPTYERAVEHLRSLYQADGFLDVRVGEPVLRRLDEENASVTIEVEEGPQARFFDVTIGGNETLGDRELAAALDLERGDPYSEAALARAVERVLERYRTHGHLYATVTQTVRFSQDRTRAAVELVVNERFPVTVGQIRIEGARQTRESVIRSMIAFEEGDTFTPERVRRTQERLLELGVFGSVVVSPADADVPEPVKDVVVTLSERLPQVLDFGAGVSTAQGVRGSFEYAYRNLFGRAITLTFRAQVSGQFFFLDPVLEERFKTLSLEQRLERRITISLALPSIGRNPNWRTSFNVMNMRDNARTFGVDKSAFDITFAYRPTRRFAFTVSPTLERNNVGLLVDDQTYEDILAMTSDFSLRQLLRVPEGRSSLAAVGTQIIVDRRDSPFSPTRGMYFSTSVEWAHTLRSQQVELAGMGTTFYSHHLRLNANASTYARLGRGVTLALQARYGRIVHLENESATYPNRQFFLGGVDTMRSYRQDAMVPQDIVDRIVQEGRIDPVALVQGGETFLLARAELRFPVLGDIGGAFFSELGNLWADAANIEPWRLRPTAGFGIRLDTPVGPIALDYGFNLLYRQDDRQLVGERIGAFNFSIGVY